MNSEIPRLRMFAGPNGSGKSTLKTLLAPELLGYFVSPDDLEIEITRDHELDFGNHGVTTAADAALPFFHNSAFLQAAGLSGAAAPIGFANNKLLFHEVQANSYIASVAADFIRRWLLDHSATFTCETVMSSPDKIELLKLALAKGYRTYLYYVATEDPQINISRVRNRVGKGGHPVPEDKIATRYVRSLDFLWDAIQ